MALYTIADLHLSSVTDKPMGIFGARWTDHTEKLISRWNALVTPDDTVVIPGDVSWGMTLAETALDFRIIDALPGKKIIGKGNHDYWWTTVAKMKKFLADTGVTTVDFLFNNAFLMPDCVVCGSRGWYIEEKLQATPDPTDYEKIVNRECMRLEASLVAGEALRKALDIPLVSFLHFPPVFGNFVCQPLIDVMKKHGVKQCYYGHIHGNYMVPHTVEYEGVNLSLISADYLNFTPRRVFI